MTKQDIKLSNKITVYESLGNIFGITNDKVMYVEYDLALRHSPIVFIDVQH